MAVHKPPEFHKCPAIGCPLVFRRKSDVGMHFRGKHLGLYTCEYCGHKALSAEKLARHRRSHTQERPFKCDQCDMTFIRKAHLISHKFIHTDTLPPDRRCVNCNKVSYNQRSSVCVKKRLCTTCAVQKHLISPLRRSPGSLAACRCFDEIERIAGIKIDHIHYNDDGTFSGKEKKGLIPGKRFAPDGIDAESKNHLYEFLGTPWHGFPDPDTPGKSHIGKEYWELHAKTMSRINLFADHGFVVHYIWQSEWDNAVSILQKLKCIHTVGSSSIEW